MLGGGGHAGARAAPHRGAVASATPAGSPANAREAITEPGPATSATGARFTFTPAARSSRPAARHALDVRPALEWLAGRTGVGERADVAPLLVDHDERPALRGTLRASV